MQTRTFLKLVAAASLMFALSASAFAEEKRPASPRGSAQTQVAGSWTDGKYQGGKWIEIDYGRPIKRQRANVFGTGKEYGKAITDEAPAWRAGANQTTRLTTEVPLLFAGKKLPAGAYSLFIELKEGAWTLALSTQPVQQQYDSKDTKTTWGSYNYDPKQDVLRAPMKLSTSAHSVDELSYRFLDVTAKGGTLEVAWDKQVATVDFTVEE
jgi:hypothetical protein